MDTLLGKIKESSEKYPDFEEFLVAGELSVDVTQSPGVRLDAAKGVYESIVKTMLGYLDQSLSKDQLNRMTLVDAIKKLLDEISRREEDVSPDFIVSMTAVVKHFSIVRNNTGDISHGHVAPKENSPDHFVALAVSYVESTCLYLFEVFMKLDLSYEMPQSYDLEESQRFNDYLDEQRDPIGNVSYSKALYELDYDAYIDEQDRYNNGEQEYADPI